MSTSATYMELVAKGVTIGKEAMVAHVKMAISWLMTTKHALLNKVMNTLFSLKP